MSEILPSLKNSNFLKLFVAVLCSEFGGYLTNTAILFYVNQLTNGDRTALGLTLISLVLPLTLGTFLGGSLGERVDKRRLMIICETSNLILVALLALTQPSLPLILILRAGIAFFAGAYNPNRLAILQELVPGAQLKIHNGMFTAIYAVLHSLGPMAAALAYKELGGAQLIFSLNIFTYIIGISGLLALNYQAPFPLALRIRPAEITKDFKEAFQFVWDRPDLRALWLKIGLGGFCSGVFYPNLLPFIRSYFAGDETMYGEFMLAFGIGGILGSVLSPWLLRRLGQGRLIVSFAFFQAILLVVWSQIHQLVLSQIVLMIWGFGLMAVLATYMSYLQVQIPQRLKARAFSIFHQTISLSVIAGAATVAAAGNRMEPSDMIGLVALIALFILLFRGASRGVRQLVQT